MKPLKKCKAYQPYQESWERWSHLKGKAKRLRNEIQDLLNSEEHALDRMDEVDKLIKGSEILAPIRKKVEKKADELEATENEIDTLWENISKLKLELAEFYFQQIDNRQSDLFKAIEAATKINEEIRDFYADSKKPLGLDSLGGFAKFPGFSSKLINLSDLTPRWRDSWENNKNTIRRRIKKKYE